ncbi:MAG: porin [Phycisphaerales bacterium]
MRRTGTWMSASVSLSLASAAAAAGPANEDALQQIEELRQQNAQLAAKIAKLEQVATDDGAWLTESRAAEIRSLVTDVLADADTRASLQADGATAGWNKGFFLASPDGSFRLNIKGQIQFRWAGDFRDVPSGTLASGSASGTDANYGFEVRRAKLTFSGHIIDPSLTFEIKPVFNRQSVTLSTTNFPSGQSASLGSASVNGSIEDIWVQKAFENGLAVRAGQFKAPFLREELVSSAAQLAVERSLLNDVFSTKFSQGVQLEWEQEMFKLQGFYGDGLRANATSPVTNAAIAANYNGSYLTDYQTNDTNWAFAGRAEFKAAGQWKQFKDLTSYRGEEFGLLFGVGAMGQSIRPTPTTATLPTSMWGVTADVTVDFGGANLFAYGVYREVNLAWPVVTRSGGSSSTAEQWGFLVQGGYFVWDDVEVFARYEFGNTDTDQFRTAAGCRLATLEELSLITVGFNFYPMGSSNKDIKFTTDFGYAMNPVGDFASSGANWNSDATANNSATSDGQFVIRSQVQLTF